MPSDQHVQRAMEIADIINSNAPLGVRVAKRAGRKFIEQEAIAAAGVSPGRKQVGRRMRRTKPRSLG